MSVALSGSSLPLLGRVRRDSLPGFGLSLGITLAWLSLIVLVPLAALVIRSWEHGLDGVLRTLSDARVFAALRLSFLAALLAALVNLPIGLLAAWVLVRLRFTGRRLLDAIVDLPFALPTAVAGLALTAFSRQMAGSGRPSSPHAIGARHTRGGDHPGFL